MLGGRQYNSGDTNVRYILVPWWEEVGRRGYRSRMDRKAKSELIATGVGLYFTTSRVKGNT